MRKIIYLKDLISAGKNNYVGGDIANAQVITALRQASTKGNQDDLSDVALDIKDIIITPSVEKILYYWMENYDLDCIDSTEEDPYFTDGEIKYIDFREECFRKMRQIFKNKNNQAKLSSFLTVDEKGEYTFRYAHSTAKLVKLINDRIKSGNSRVLTLSLDNVPTDAESIRDLAEALLYLNNKIKIPYNDLIGSPTLNWKVIPVMSRILYGNLNNFDNLMQFKYSMPVGTECYISINSQVYRKCVIIKNDFTDEEGTDFRDYGVEITEEQMIRSNSVEIKYLDEQTSLPAISETVLKEDGEDEEDGNGEEDGGVDTVADLEAMHTGTFEFSLRLLGLTEILILPVAFFEASSSGFIENDQMDLPPTSVIRDNIKQLTITELEEYERKAMYYNYDKLTYLNTDKPLGMDADWINEARKQERKKHHKEGNEIGFIDLEDVINGTHVSHIKPLAEDSLN